MKSRHFTFLIIAVYFFTIPLSAHAYLDPGTITFVVQSIVAVFVGIALYIKLFWFKFKKFFSVFSKSAKETPPQSSLNKDEQQQTKNSHDEQKDIA